MPKIHNFRTRTSEGREGTKPQDGASPKGLTLNSGHAANDNVSGPNADRIREIKRALNNGAAILPVVAGGKAPAISGGVKSATTNGKVLAARFTSEPDLNYGIATGKMSGIFALDLDGPEGKKTLAALIDHHGHLPKTVRVMTPNGEHLYFKAPGYPVPNSAGKIGPGVDIRGDGGYVLGAGSRTSDGVYRYFEGRRLGEIKIADAPAWLLDRVGRHAPNAVAPAAPAVEISPQHSARAKSYADAAFASECGRLRKAPVHQRNHTLNVCGFKLGRLVARGLLNRAHVAAELAAIAKAIGLDESEIAPTIESGLAAGTKHPARLPFEKSGVSNGPANPPRVADNELTRQLASFGEDDIANAERFARRCGIKVIYSLTRGYLVFDGKRYRADRGQLYCIALAKNVVTKIAEEAPFITSEDARARRAKFAQQSRSKAAIDRMVDLAKELLVVEDSALDGNPWLLNTETCTIDLRTGVYYPHDARDLLTKIAPVKAKLNAPHPVFDAFLKRITSDDKQLAEYIQKAVGYSLTGDATEQVFFFVFGKSGSNGKSTLVNIIRDMLGEYATHTPTETLQTKNYDNAIPADLARLEGVRMVTAVESNVNRQLDEAKVKAMTGGDPITARLLYKDYSTFTPQFKLWMVANDRPRVRATDDAMWRRIRVIPLNVKIPPGEVDPELSTKLKAELPGILSWAVQGALMWQRNRLAEPESVKAASADWRESVDHVRRFVTETLITGCALDEQVKAGELHSLFKTWCVHLGELPLSPGKFKARLEEAFDLTHVHTKGGSVWRGVRMKT
jgi:putative DNA primase/helicase